MHSLILNNLVGIAIFGGFKYFLLQVLVLGDVSQPAGGPGLAGI